MLTKVLLDEPPRLRELVPEIPEGIEQLVASMLAKEPRSRPADAAEVLRALASAAESPPSGATGDRATDPAPDRRTPPARSDSMTLSTKERRLATIVLAGRRRVSDLDKTVSAEDVAALLERTRDLVGGFGGRADALADGTLVVCITGLADAATQALQAARCALALAAALPEAGMVIATGRGVTSEGVPLGQVLDEAARLFEIVGNSPHIRVDSLSGDLLARRFELGHDADGSYLIREKSAVAPVRLVAGRRVPFIGRERELAALQAIWAQCEESSVARVHLVTAEPGHGKSRLLEELVRALRAQHPKAIILAARGDIMSAGAAYALAAQLARAGLGALDIRVNVDRETALLRLGEPRANAERVLPFAAELGRLRVESWRSQALIAARRDPVLMGDQLEAAFAGLLDALSRRGPVLVLLEDIHWGDRASFEIIDSALRRLRRRPLMVLATGRQELHDRFPGLWTSRGLSETRLPELTEPACKQIARSVLGEAAPAEMIDRIVARAAGHAFFLEEILRAAVQGSDAESPPTVLAVLQSRLEALPDPQRRILRAGSIMGRSFWSGAVAELLGVDGPGALETELDELVDRELLLPGDDLAPGTGGGFHFSHALLRDAAYGMLTDSDRVNGHRLVAEWLERRDDELALTIAEHFARGNQPARAGSHYIRAARQALAGQDLLGALERVERARASLPEPGGELELIEAEALRWRGQLERAERLARRALGLLAAGTADWYRAAAEHVQVAVRLGHSVAALETAEAVVAEPIVAGAEPIISCCRVAESMLRGGMPELGGALLERAEARASELGLSDPDVEAWLLQSSAWRAAVGGRFADALSLCLTAGERFDQAGNARNACHARALAAVKATDAGRLDVSEQLARDAIAGGQTLGLVHLEVLSSCVLGQCLLLQDRTAEAIEWLERATSSLSEHGDRMIASVAEALWALAQARAGDPAAGERSERALERAGALPWPRHVALAVRAYVLLEARRLEEARSAAAESIELSGSVVPTMAALARLVLARCLEGLGHAEPKANAVAEAVAWLRARAAAFDPEAQRAFLYERWDHAQILQLAT